MIDRTLPPRGFGTCELYSAPLRVYFQGGRFWVYDKEGFLCSCNLEELGELLKAEAVFPPPVGQRWMRARAVLDPEWETRRLAGDIAYLERVKKDREEWLKKQSQPKQRLSLSDLGL